MRDDDRQPQDRTLEEGTHNVPASEAPEQNGSAGRDGGSKHPFKVDEDKQPAQTDRR